MINGMINVYKEKGYTSHDVIARLRGIVGQKKIGHTGTLDPDATGVLPVCLGRATKVCDLLTDKNKTYDTVLLLGLKTDTQDISGTILEQREVKHLSADMVKRCVFEFLGEYHQIPPMYSALKVNGKKLYEFARQGIEIERKPRVVNILDIQIHKIDLPRVYMTVTCSKGTYIRTLCQDIGQRLKVGGCMEELIRTRVSIFDIEESLTLNQIETAKEKGTLLDHIIPIDALFQNLPQVHLNRRGLFLVSNGNCFSMDDIIEVDLNLQKDVLVRVYSEENQFLAIYRYEENEVFKIEKMFYQKEMKA